MHYPVNTEAGRVGARSLGRVWARRGQCEQITRHCGRSPGSFVQVGIRPALVGEGRLRH